MKRLLSFFAVIAGLAAITAALILVRADRFQETKLPDSKKPTTAKTIPDFKHVVIIVEENQSYNQVINNSDAPYINKLARQYSQANRYYALFRPSLPNYIATIAGTNGGIKSNCTPGPDCQYGKRTLIDEITKSGRSWKAYQENMPSNCLMESSGKYAVRHNPFVYFTRLTRDQQGCRQHVTPYSRLAKDLKANRLPNFTFITPNLCNDMHDCSVKTGDNWLAREIPKILRSKAFKDRSSLLILTWDEAAKDDASNRIPTLLIGPAVKKAYKSNRVYSHYSLLRTIEKAWDLPALTTNDRKASTLAEFFR